jgi:hypothetical protein
MNKRVLGTAITVAALTVAMPTTSATAAPAPTASKATPQLTTLTTKVSFPFGIAVNHGKVYVADGGTATVSRLSGANLVTVAKGPQGEGNDVAGIAFSHDGATLAYTTSLADHSRTTLEIRGPFGSRRSVDLAAYEKSANPDKKIHYGVDNPSDCVKSQLAKLGDDAPPATYPGQVDSHPYAVEAYGANAWIVADAGGNDLVKVDRRGKVSTVAVLPRQPYKVTPAGAVALGLASDSCLVGQVYNFEAVPTGVDVRNGRVYVTTLAGGPETPALGARSKVYRVNPKTGKATVVARGLSGATNLAVGRGGRIFVTEYYSGEVSVIRNGRIRTIAKVPQAVSIADTRTALYVGTTPEFGPSGPIGTGSVVRIR